MIIDVERYGIVPGAKPNDAPFSAMMRIIKAGDVIQFEAGRYLFENPIIIGDGQPAFGGPDKGKVSSLHGVTIAGRGAGAGPSEIGMSPITEIACPGIRLRGPIAECAIQNLTLNGGGIEMAHAFRCRVERVNVWNPRSFGLWLQGNPGPLPPGCAVNASANSIRDLRIQLAYEYTIGIILGQDAVIGEGTSQNRFERCAVIGNGSLKTNIGLSLRFCDYNIFEMLQISYCRKAYVDIPFIAFSNSGQQLGGNYPSNIIMRDAVLQDPQPIHWDPRWNPLTSGIHLEKFVREWDGNNPALDTSYGPTFPKHPKIFGSDTTGRIYTR